MHNQKATYRKTVYSSVTSVFISFIHFVGGMDWLRMHCFGMMHANMTYASQKGCICLQMQALGPVMLYWSHTGVYTIT
jgi:hypothetical protein